MNKEGQLRIEQRVGEGADMFLVRAYMKAVPYMARHEALAVTRWMLSKSADRSTPLLDVPMTRKGRAAWTPERIALRDKFLARRAKRLPR